MKQKHSCSALPIFSLYACTVIVAVLLKPFIDVALIWWLPFVVLAGRVAFAVNAPLASVVTWPLVTKVSLSTIKVTC